MSHPHYFKDVSGLKAVDVYRVLELFEVTLQPFSTQSKSYCVPVAEATKTKQRTCKRRLIRWCAGSSCARRMGNEQTQSLQAKAR